MEQHLNERGYAYQAEYTPSIEQSEQRVGLPQGSLNIERVSAPREPAASAGQRVALAIVSLVVLMFMTLIVTGFLTNGGRTISWPIVALLGTLVGMLCITVIAVNIVFNWRH